MQPLKNQNRIGTCALALLLSSTMMLACNNEGETTTEPAVDTPAVTAPAATPADSLPPVDTSATTRPDGSTTGGASL